MIENRPHPMHLLDIPNTYMLRWMWYALLLSTSIGSLSAQQLNQHKRLSQYVMKSWDTEDGLTSEAASEMAQTDDGYIWIGTYTGLHRFDGKDFTVFTNQNSELPSSNVLRIEKGINGELWVGTLHGVTTIKNSVFKIPEGLEQTVNLSIEDMLIARDGALWFSTKSNQLFYHANGKLEEYTSKLKVEKSTVLSIEEDQNGTIYLGTDDSRFIIYANNEVNVIELGIDVNGVNTLLARDSLMYLGTGTGLYTWDGSAISKSPILGQTTINSIFVDSSTLWLGTMNGLFRYHQPTDKMDSLTEETGIPNNIVQDLLFDTQGNLWVGTYRSGFFFLGDGSITSFGQNDGLETNIISSVVEIEEDTYILGNENGVLNLLKNGEVSEYSPPIPIPSERLKHLFYDSKGRIWVSTYGGLVVIDGDKGRHYTVANGFPDNFVRVAFEDADGTIWVGTKNAGLLLFDNLDNWTSITVDDGLTSNYILSLEQQENGDIVAGTISGLNIIRDKKVWKPLTVEDGLPSNFMFATHSTENYIWIASNDGLIGYSDDQVIYFNTENGLPTNIIYDILEDKEGNFWMPSENSILSIKIDDLEKAGQTNDYSFQVRQYDESYGMKNSHCLGAVLSFTDSKNQFWIPTIGGIVRLNPVEVEPPSFEPNILIENIYSGNERIPLSDEVILPSGSNRLTIDFTGISYAQTNLLQFRYRMNPFDDSWIISSPERTATYTNLSPGEYTFEIQIGLEGAYNTNSLRQRIIIEAAWWQTPLSRILGVLSIILIALLIYWMRMKALRANNIRLEEIVHSRTKEIEDQKQELKTAIDQLKSAQEQMIQSDKMASLGILAAGVAHEINNPLNFIQGGVEGLEQKLKKNKGLKKEEYSVMIGAIKEGISRASTIVRSLNEFSHASEIKQEPCDIYHLIENCLTMIRYRLKNDIKLTKNYSDQKAVVLGNNGKLHQALLNIITNSIQAIEKKGTIGIKTEVLNGSITIEFSDSGQGIKPEHLKKITEPFFSTKEPGKGTGLGLSITYTIINEHGGTLKYDSKWGHGTTATVTLPLMKN